MARLGRNGLQPWPGLGKGWGFGMLEQYLEQEEAEATEERTKPQHPSSGEDPITKHQTWILGSGVSRDPGPWKLELSSSCLLLVTGTLSWRHFSPRTRKSLVRHYPCFTDGGECEGRGKLDAAKFPAHNLQTTIDFIH